MCIAVPICLLVASLDAQTTMADGNEGIFFEEAGYSSGFLMSYFRRSSNSPRNAEAAAAFGHVLPMEGLLRSGSMLQVIFCSRISLPLKTIV